MPRIHTHETLVDLPAELLYRAFIDIKRWPEWDDGLAATEHDGSEIRPGSRFSLTPKGGRTIAMRVAEVEPPRLFVDRASLPLGWLETRHEFVAMSDGRTLLRHAVRAGGLLGALWNRLIARTIAADHPAQIGRFVAFAGAQS